MVIALGCVFTCFHAPEIQKENGSSADAKPKEENGQASCFFVKKVPGEVREEYLLPHACEGRFTMHNNLQQCACHTPEFACSVQLDTVSIQVLVQQSKVSTRSIDSLFFCNRSLGQSCFGQCGAWSRAWRLHWFCIPVVQ